MLTTSLHLRLLTTPHSILEHYFFWSKGLNFLHHSLVIFCVDVLVFDYHSSYNFLAIHCSFDSCSIYRPQSPRKTLQFCFAPIKVCLLNFTSLFFCQEWNNLVTVVSSKSPGIFICFKEFILNFLDIFSELFSTLKIISQSLPLRCTN